MVRVSGADSITMVFEPGEGEVESDGPTVETGAPNFRAPFSKETGSKSRPVSDTGVDGRPQFVKK